jgi:hypothetical protein
MFDTDGYVFTCEREFAFGRTIVQWRMVPSEKLPPREKGAEDTWENIEAEISKIRIGQLNADAVVMDDETTEAKGFWSEGHFYYCWTKWPYWMSEGDDAIVFEGELHCDEKFEQEELEDSATEEEDELEADVNRVSKLRRRNAWSEEDLKAAMQGLPEDNDTRPSYSLEEMWVHDNK